MTMSLEHRDVVKHSVHIYCTWLRHLLPSSSHVTDDSSVYGRPASRSEVPLTVKRDPNRYARDMLYALTRVFLPRGVDATLLESTGGVISLFNALGKRSQNRSNISSSSALLGTKRPTDGSDTYVPHTTVNGVSEDPGSLPAQQPGFTGSTAPTSISGTGCPITATAVGTGHSSLESGMHQYPTILHQVILSPDTRLHSSCMHVTSFMLDHR
ncbi:unnamed protein product [Protopolystoma xenopodis]|uniref:Uncharacterized protein n=1 Tax=Protopolystoma xenopodis TaxID=117903 RepID=A0A448X6A3_9PLAT|nr:unnamed protein product [Protopolystoma xenopodis]